MPSSQFSAALSSLDPAIQARVTAQLDDWKAGAITVTTAAENWGQVARNIESETAIPIPDFADLLSLWIRTIDAGDAAGTPPPTSTVENSWVTACRTQRGGAFLGRELVETESPPLLGRAITLSRYVAIARPDPFYPPDAVRQALLSCPDGDTTVEHPGFEDYLRTRPVGRFLIWSTFNERDGDAVWFRDCPGTTSGICAILGLMEPPPGEVMMLLAYDRAAYASHDPATGDRLDLMLHRPTVAEAEGFPLFRPWHEPGHRCGYTFPTPPPPHGLTGRPEVVHREIDGKGLRFPYRLTIT